MRILKTFNAVEGWPWRVIKDSSGLGVQAKSNFGWETYDNVFDSIEEAIKFAEKTAYDMVLDSQLSKLSGGAL